MPAIGGAVTVLADRAARWWAVAGTVSVSAFLVLPLGVDYVQAHPSAWAGRIPRAGATAWLAVAAVIVVVGCIRAAVMGVFISDAGVVVRNYWRTYRMGWPEVAMFVDGETSVGERWALIVLTRSGTGVFATGTARYGQARFDLIAAIQPAAERYGITAKVTGKPTKWEGPEWPGIPGGVWLLVMLVLLIAALAFVPGSWSCPPGGCSGG